MSSVLCQTLSCCGNAVVPCITMRCHVMCTCRLPLSCPMLRCAPSPCTAVSCIARSAMCPQHLRALRCNVLHCSVLHCARCNVSPASPCAALCHPRIVLPTLRCAVSPCPVLCLPKPSAVLCRTALPCAALCRAVSSCMALLYCPALCCNALHGAARCRSIGTCRAVSYAVMPCNAAPGLHYTNAGPPCAVLHRLALPLCRALPYAVLCYPSIACTVLSHSLLPFAALCCAAICLPHRPVLRCAVKTSTALHCAATCLLHCQVLRCTLLH